MFRFIAAVLDTANEKNQRDAKLIQSRIQANTGAWNLIYLDANCFVYCPSFNTSDVTLLDQDHGCILGTIFRKHASDLLTSSISRNLDSTLTKRLIDSGGTYLVEAYWGSYVAILRDAEHARTWILRSPAGNLPCLTARYNGIDLYFSFLPDLMELRLLRFSINWPYVSRHLIKSISVEQTGLNEVQDVRSGECVQYKPLRDKARRFYWDVRKIVEQPRIEDRSYAANELRRVTKACVRAWASKHQSILHSLSGGLDSSIVAACLKDLAITSNIQCFTHHSAGSNSDERRYARLVAERLHMDLTEISRNPDFRLQEALRTQVSERPRPYAVVLESQRQENILARHHGASAIFSGNRGDEVFLVDSRHAPADYLRHRGFRRELISVAMSTARLECLSIWKVLGEALQNGLLSRPWNPMNASRPYHPLMTEDAIQMLQERDQGVPPWFLADGSIPIGKQQHIFTLINPEVYYFQPATPDAPEDIAPLASQPLIELVALMPTYILTGDARDRVIARRAFADELPREVVERRTKGGMEEYAEEIARNNLPFLRELLLDGNLVKEKLLSREKLADALSGRPCGLMKGMGKLFHYINVEMWLRIWSQEELQKAA